MIRVLVKASSPIANAGLESLLQGNPALQVVEDSYDEARGNGAESPPEVLLVEVATLADHAARKAMDFAAAGGPWFCWCATLPLSQLRMRCAWA
jgi:hypothetical protein